MVMLDTREWNRWLKERFPKKDIITLEELLGDYEDLIDEVNDLKEQIEDMQQNIEDNYIQKTNIN